MYSALLVKMFGVALAITNVSAIAARTQKDCTKADKAPLPNQMLPLNEALSDDSYRGAFNSAFQEAMGGPAQAAIPPKDESNGEQSLMFEKELRRKMLEETTKLVHAIEVAKQIGVINYKGASEQRSFNASDAEDTARNTVMRLAESLVRSDNRFEKWVPGMTTLYNKFVKNVIMSVELLISPSAESMSAELGRLVASVGLLLTTILERGVYSASQIADAFSASQLHNIFEDIGVVIDLAGY